LDRMQTKMDSMRSREVENVIINIDSFFVNLMEIAYTLYNYESN